MSLVDSEVNSAETKIILCPKIRALRHACTGGNNIVVPYRLEQALRCRGQTLLGFALFRKSGEQHHQKPHRENRPTGNHGSALETLLCEKTIMIASIAELARFRVIPAKSFIHAAR